MAIREALTASEPTVTGYRSGLAAVLRRLAGVELASGDIGGASARAGKAAGLCEGLPPRSGGEWFELACARATLAAAAGREDSGRQDGSARPEAGRAMAALLEATARGYRNRDALRREPALEPLRHRDDFRLLMMDLAFPAEIFASVRVSNERSGKTFISKVAKDTDSVAIDPAVRILEVDGGDILDFLVPDKDVLASDIVGISRKAITTELIARKPSDLSFGRVKQLRIAFLPHKAAATP